MKVLHIASGDSWGGAERVLSILLPAQQRGGIECEALLLNEGHLAARLRSSGIVVHVVPEGGRSFGSLLREIRPLLLRSDIVHAHRYKEVAAAALTLGSRGHKLVVTIHGLEPAAQLGFGGVVQTWGALWLARVAGARLVGVSQELGDRLARVMGPRRVKVIANPAPEPTTGGLRLDLREKFGWSPDRPLIGFVGRLEPVKGPDLFLEIADAISSNASFVFVGSGSMESKLRVAAKREGLEGRVGFLGSVPDAMLLLQQLDVLALPSRHEGLPMVLLEAAVLGVPVVAFDVGGVRQVLDGGPAARVVEQGNISEFAAELERIVRSRRMLGSDIEAWSANVQGTFSVARVVASYTDLYRRTSQGN